MVGLLFGGWDVSDWFEESSVVEPVDVFEGGVRRGRGLAMVPGGSVLFCRARLRSARALSYESPTDPTDGDMPVSVRRSV